MSLIRLLPARLHAIADYVVAAALIIVPLILRGPMLAVATGVVVGIVVLVISALTRYPLGVVKVLPFTIHSAGDYLATALLVAAPFALHFYHTDPKLTAFYVAAGIAVLAVSLVTDYQYSPKRSAAVPAPQPAPAPVPQSDPVRQPEPARADTAPVQKAFTPDPEARNPLARDLAIAYQNATEQAAAQATAAQQAAADLVAAQKAATQQIAAQQAAAKQAAAYQAAAEEAAAQQVAAEQVARIAADQATAYQAAAEQAWVDQDHRN